MSPIIDKHLPVKRMSVREKDVPSMTLEWKRAIRKRGGMQNNMQGKRMKKIKNLEINGGIKLPEEGG